MIEQILWRFLESDKRKQIVIIGTILTGLVAIWPAADEYRAAKERIRTAIAELQDSQRQIDQLPKLVQVYDERRAELQKLEDQTVGEKEAQRLRNRITNLVPREGCEMRRMVLADALVRDWTENDSPVGSLSITDRGNDTPFSLATRQMTISIRGPMANIKSFLKELNGIKRLVHTKTFSLQRSGQSDKRELDIDLLLFDLPLKSTT